ncbi:MAG: nickel pincer cofactor biosynthesis protein LarB [Caldisericia bacterium]|jgi:NCAIR mutase (PurE)-related protein|nr:nickel pincer cofactor biosynthesis protein LarB [Caldisericia bacterium]
MDLDYLKKILLDFKENKINLEEILKIIQELPYEDLGFAKVDHLREIRKGFPEVVFCERKKDEDALKIILKLYEKSKKILATRANENLFKLVKDKIENAEFNPFAKTISICEEKPKEVGKIIILTAGTSDIPVAEEAYETAKIMGNSVEKIYDVGVAGIHRLFDNLQKIREAKVLIVVAGMDGVLPSVVGGLVNVPVIAVPTSVGYGANFGGVSALLTMLNSCSPGVAVVNIDNGFGAGFVASLINKIGESE